MHTEQFQDGFKLQYSGGKVDHIICTQTLHDALYLPMAISLSELTIVHIEQQAPTIFSI